MNPHCPYCERQSELVTGNIVYQHRPDLKGIYFYLCKPCYAYVGVHPGTTTSLGNLADGELRAKRVDVHRLFDPLWKDKTMSRQAAYRWLSLQMGIKKKRCHIGLFTTELCDQAIAILKENLK